MASKEIICKKCGQVHVVHGAIIRNKEKVYCLNSCGEMEYNSK